MTSNQRITIGFTGGSGLITYTITHGADTIFIGRVHRTSSEAVTVDITDIVVPYVSAPDLGVSSKSGITSLSATFGISATGATASANSITVDYLNDFASTDVSSPAPTIWAAPVFGQPKYSYSSRTAYTVTNHTDGDCVKKRYAIIWTNRWGMPESIGVHAVVSASSTWEGLRKQRNLAGNQHRTTPLSAEEQLSFNCTTPIIAKGLREQFVRSLGMAQKVYLYDIDRMRLYPCVTPSVSDINDKSAAITITLTTAY